MEYRKQIQEKSERTLQISKELEALCRESEELTRETLCMELDRLRMEAADLSEEEETLLLDLDAECDFLDTDPRELAGVLESLEFDGRILEREYAMAEVCEDALVILNTGSIIAQLMIRDEAHDVPLARKQVHTAGIIAGFFQTADKALSGCIQLCIEEDSRAAWEDLDRITAAQVSLEAVRARNLQQWGHLEGLDAEALQQIQENTMKTVCRVVENGLLHDIDRAGELDEYLEELVSGGAHR